VIFSTRPWKKEDGSAAYPYAVEGARVIRHIRTRRDEEGALVLLDDGRYAITGPALAMGAAAQVQRYARRRLSAELTDAERAWWQEVVGALAR
jgi:cell volume regulation protein A